MRKVSAVAALAGVALSLDAGAQLAPPQRGAPVSVSYDGGTIFRSEDGRFELKVNGRFQARYDMLRRTDPDTDESEVTQRFLLPRTRLGMEGFAFTPSFTYKTEGSFGDDNTPRLRDFYGNVALRGDALQLRFGQWKRPFNRQEIVSDFGTELPEKALTNAYVGGARDIGVALHNGYDRSPDGVEWVVAFMNGGVDVDDFAPELIARLGVNVGGIRGYSEGDLEGGPLRFAAALGYRLANLDNGPLTHLAGVDAVLKVSGLSLQVAGFVRKVEDAGDATFAGHVQGGAFVVPGHAQLTARFAIVPLPLVAGGEQEYRMEIRGGANYYFFGHNLKVSSDLGALSDTTEGATAALAFRLQGQLVF
jgi:hypothetical protein